MILTNFRAFYFFFFLLLTAFSCAVQAIPAPPKIDATSSTLIDYHSGKVLVAVNADERVEPASLTKMMTAYIVYDEIAKGRITLDTETVVSEKAWRMEGSRMFLEVGKKVKVGPLIKGLVIQSGNDASIVLAELVAGDEASFADYMNQYAQKLGMSNTHFMNATGLPHPEHYTTAQDMGVLARALIKQLPERYKTYSQKEFTYNKIRQENRNRLLWRDDSVDGIKTGHTQSAGYSLVASAKKNDMRLISVVMGAKSDKVRTRENAKLLRYGFSFYETHKLYQAGAALDTPRIWKGEIKTVPVGLQEDLYITVERGQYSQLKPAILMKSPLLAPVMAGDAVGSLEVMMADERLFTSPVIALENISEGNFFRQLLDSALLYFE